jgi:hypothetical protein
MIVYYSTDYKTSQVLKNLQNKRTANGNPANFLSCPAVRDCFHNVYAFSLPVSTVVNYDINLISSTNGLEVSQGRKPHLFDSNIFRIENSSYFFSEEPLKIKVTAPYFHKVSYQSEATFVGGVFDIGRWFRPIQSEIITWQEKGKISFKENEPLFYVEFLTDENVELKKFRLTPTIEFLSSALVNSPFQNKENMQGTLESRYEAFERSDFRLGLLEEIKANLVSEDSASPSV